MTPDLPGWLIYVLGIVTGALLILAIGPASDTFWEAVYWVRRVCLITGACVLGGGALFGIFWAIAQAHSS